MKLRTMWSALGQWDKKEATSRGCDCEHLWQILGGRVVVERICKKIHVA